MTQQASNEMSDREEKVIGLTNLVREILEPLLAPLDTTNQDEVIAARAKEIVDPWIAGVRIRPAHKRTWIASLRSGTYTQTTSYLAKRNRNGTYEFCCLGVGIEACAPGFWLDELRVDKDDGIVTKTCHDDNYQVWPDDVEEFFLEEGDDYTEEGTRTTLASGLAGLNDAHVTFAQIADILEYF